MLNEVLQAINNYFVLDYCDLTQIESDGLTVSNPELFIVGQYVLVLGSKLNDGVYKIATIVGSKISVSVDDDLFAESGDMRLCGLGVPRAVLSLVDEITEFNIKNSGGITNESLGDYSVGYANSNGDVSWISAFRKKLAPYKKVYLNLPYKAKDDSWYR